ncbi:DNA repair ATPase [Streptomyces californicus]
MIKLGRHRFAVNTQPFDLTLVPSGDRDGAGRPSPSR